MKNLVLVYSVVLFSVQAFAEPSQPYKRGFGHRCMVVLARLNSGNKVSTSEHDLTGRFDQEIDTYLKKQWRPDEDSRLGIVAQMREFASNYEQLRAEGFSANVSKIAASRHIDEIIKDLHELRQLTFSDEQIYSMLRISGFRYLDHAIEVAKKSKWSVESVVEMQSLFLAASQKLINSHWSLLNSKPDSSGALLDKMAKAAALIKNLNVDNLVGLSELGLSAREAFDVCDRLAHMAPNDERAVPGYILARSNKIPHDEAMVLSSVMSEKSKTLILKLREEGFATSNILDIVLDPFLSSFTLPVFERAFATNHSVEEARIIALKYPRAFLRWFLRAAESGPTYRGPAFEIPSDKPAP